MTHILLFQRHKTYDCGWFVSCDHEDLSGYVNIDTTGTGVSGPHPARGYIRDDLAAVRLQESLVVAVRL